MWEQCQWQELAGSGGRCCWMLVQVPSVPWLVSSAVSLSWLAHTDTDCDHWSAADPRPVPCPHWTLAHCPDWERTYIWLIPGQKSTSEIYFQICDGEIFIKLAGIQNCRIDSGKVFREESWWVSSNGLKNSYPLLSTLVQYSISNWLVLWYKR